MRAYALTDVGKLRSTNQDYIFSSPDAIGSLDNLFLLADGMGGHQAGDFASRYVAEQMAAYVKQNQEVQDLQGLLKEGIRQVNRGLYLEAQGNSDLSGMGTTLVMATIRENTLHVFNIGDSRLYLLRDKLEQITRDHSYVEELVLMGKMVRGSRDYQDKKNIITRAVGTSRSVEADLFTRKLRQGDILLLCSDGLTNMVDEFEIEYIIRSEGDMKERAEALVAAANRNGGRDNISVILIEPQISEVSIC